MSSQVKSSLVVGQVKCKSSHLIIVILHAESDLNKVKRQDKYLPVNYNNLDLHCKYSCSVKYILDLHCKYSCSVKYIMESNKIVT